jgi:hypothetical protein
MKESRMSAGAFWAARANEAWAGLRTPLFQLSADKFTHCYVEPLFVIFPSVHPQNPGPIDTVNLLRVRT